jgi:hypothetical protein
MACDVIWIGYGEVERIFSIERVCDTIEIDDVSCGWIILIEESPDDVVLLHVEACACERQRLAQKCQVGRRIQANVHRTLNCS